MKKHITLILGVFFILSCSKDDPTENIDQNSDNQKIFSIEEINSFIETKLKEQGDLDWTRDASAYMLYSAVMHGGKVLTIGFGEKGESFVNGTQRSSRLSGVIEGIYATVQSTEGLSKSSIQVSEDETLNVLDVRITKLETIEELKAMDHIRYLEPNGYGFYLQEANQEKSAGCNQSGQSINSADYSIIAPNARVPWNYNIHNIPQAWELSSGAGITVGLIDSGVSANQNLLGNGFNDGASNGRSIQKVGTYIDSIWWWSNNIDGPNDRCGHGTQMASIIASPRNNDFMPMGVAYNANLISYRGTSDVVLEDYHERKGVSDALKQLGNNGNVKIISMSIGYPWSIGNVKDAVRYAYSRGKLIIAAGGTSTTFTNWYGVIFPASMSETVAVTGLKDNGYNRCNICHDGNKIDFTFVMQRAGDSNRNVPVLGFNNGDQSYVGGSSAATAATAGIAALVWARNPSMTRAQVLDKLKKSAEFYPNRNSKFGYGNIDALKAVQ